MLSVFIQTTKPRMTPLQYFSGGLLRREESKILENTEPADKQLPFRAFLIRPVLIAAGSYAMFALVDMAFRTLVPVFYALPIELGGLGLDPPAIGTILAIFGMSSGIIQWLFFAPTHDWLGPKRVYIAAVSGCIPMVALFPVINAVARVYGLCYLVWLLVGFQLTMLIFATFAFCEFVCLLQRDGQSDDAHLISGLVHVYQ